MFFTSTSEAIKCYICGGQDAELQLLEAKASNYNESIIKQKVHSSCDEFDRINLEEKHNYEMNCPEEFAGCMLKVGSMKVIYLGYMMINHKWNFTRKTSKTHCFMTRDRHAIECFCMF